MNENGPNNLILRYLRDIDRKVDELHDAIRTLNARVTALEKAFSVAIELIAAVSGRIDRIEGRLDRIERRLEL